METRCVEVNFQNERFQISAKEHRLSLTRMARAMRATSRQFSTFCFSALAIGERDFGRHHFAASRRLWRKRDAAVPNTTRASAALAPFSGLLARRTAALGFILLLLCTMTLPLGAQTASSLLAISIQPGQTQTTVVFRFLPATPFYRINPESGTTVSIIFSNTTVSQHIANHIAGAGSVGGIDVTQGSLGVVTARLTLPSLALLNVVRSPNELRVVVPAAPGSSSGLTPGNTSIQSTGAYRVSVIPIHYARLDEIAQTLAVAGSNSPAVDEQALPSQSILGQSSNGIQSAGSYSAPSTISTAPQGSLDPSPVAIRINEHVMIDKRLYAVIVSGTDQDVASITALVKAIDVPDVPAKSVILETEIVDLTDTGAKNLGIDFTNNGALVAATLQTGNLTGSNQPQLTIQAQLNAQISNGNGKLIAKPRIQTVDGSPASILTGDALPILTTITYPGSPPTVQQQLQYVNVGVHLQVQPFVSSDNYVTSKIVCEVSSVTGYITGNIPQLSQRQAIATARVRDGQPYVIGGLVQTNEINSLARLPLLGSLPLIGWLFRTENDSSQRENLYIVVTPHIVRSE
jgi:general secretion pathway protein D